MHRTPQTPLPSGYGATTTAREVIGDRRLDRAVAVVTGGYAGIGLETTRVLAGAGATVIVPARSPDKARAALAGIERVELEQLDLGDPVSIDAFAARFAASGRPLHILVNNAGIMAAPEARDARGFESQLATNHIGHFQLTLRLWPALRRAGGARVVALSSRGHARAAVDFDDPQFARRPYDKWLAYGQSKTANALFAVGLDARGAAHGVRAFSGRPASSRPSSRPSRKAPRPACGARPARSSRAWAACTARTSISPLPCRLTTPSRAACDRGRRTPRSPIGCGSAAKPGPA